MITEKSNRLQVIVITDYDYPISVIRVLIHVKGRYIVYKNLFNRPCVNINSYSNYQIVFKKNEIVTLS